MIATLALMAAAYAPVDAVQFSHKFVKDEKTSYTLEASGGDSGGDLVMKAEYDLTTQETKDGKTPVKVHVTKSSATAGGQDVPMETTDLDATLDSHGAPTGFQMEGFESIFYVALMMQYLPDAKLNVGDTYKIDYKFEGGTYKGDGKYTGDQELEGKKYAVLESTGEFTPDGQSAGKLTIKHYFDPASGKIARSDISVAVDDGNFKLTIKLKKPAA